jgi:hypothetical protein
VGIADGRYILFALTARSVLMRAAIAARAGLAIITNQQAGNSLSVALSKRFSAPRASDK